MKKQVLVTIAQKPKINEWAFKYALLSLNNSLKCIEIGFADSPNSEFVYPDGNFIDQDDAINIYNQKKDIFTGRDGEVDFEIAIVSSRFSKNWFSISKEGVAIVTTDAWEKAFAPPSVIEYLIYTIFAQLLYMDDDLAISSHNSTKGCIVDFNLLKNNKPGAILSGYISEDIAEKIENIRGQDYLNDFKYVLSREWLGDRDQYGTVGWNLKYSYGFDIFKDSGFKKSFWEKAWEFAPEKFWDIVIYVSTGLLGAIGGYFLAKAG